MKEIITEMTATDVLAGLAFVVSIFAAIQATRAANQARRQADAVLGNVPPRFSLFQTSDEKDEYINTINIEVVNHNRLPLHVEGWSFQHPENVIVYPQTDNEKDTILSIIHVVKYSKPDFVFKNPMRLPGCDPNIAAHRLSKIYKVTEKGRRLHQEAKIGLKITYRLDGMKEAETAYCSTTVHPSGLMEAPSLDEGSMNNQVV